MLIATVTEFITKLETVYAHTSLIRRLRQLKKNATFPVKTVRDASVPFT